VLQLRVQPRASRDGLIGVHEGRLKVRITAPPVDGKANQHLQRWLAERFQVGRAQVRIEQGDTGRDKRVRLVDVDALPAALVALAAATV
jgi:uncharacterized protein (TIGR00251 family)